MRKNLKIFIGLFCLLFITINHCFAETDLEKYQKACDLNISSGCYNLGVLYANGQGVRQDYTQANTLYKKSCDMGYAGGCLNLGFLYVKGLSVTQNMQTAKELFGKACDLGEQKGCDAYKSLNQ